MTAATVFVVGLIVVVFIVDSVVRSWRANAWQRRKPDDD
jgi:hypothetical protein